MTGDAEHIARHATGLAARLRRRARAARPPGGPARLGRIALGVRRALLRHLRAVFREHWDVGLFDLAFGCVKAFGVYPALYFAGLAWTIPLMEYAPLNTQLWTAGYLIARRKLASARGRLRFGHSLERLDALRDRSLGVDVSSRDARTVHRFAGPDGPRQVRVRRSRLRGWWERVRGRRAAPGLVEQRELRRMLGDPELRFRTDALRANPYLYERVLLEAILADPAARPALLERAVAPPRLEGPAAELAALVGDGPEPVRARLELERDRLARLLRRRLSRRPSGRLGGAASLAPFAMPIVVAFGLRALHAAWRRAAHRGLAELRELEYRLLADLAEGIAPSASPRAGVLRARRGALRADLERATALVERAEQVRSVAEARRLLAAGLAEARAAGLPARRAHLAAGLLASCRIGPGDVAGEGAGTPEHPPRPTPSLSPSPVPGPASRRSPTPERIAG